MSETKRTPGKWYYEHSAPTISDFEILSDAGNAILAILPSHRRAITSFDERVANADYICRAVNCHERLVDLLKELRDSVVDVKPLLLPDVDDIIDEAEGGGNG